MTYCERMGIGAFSQLHLLRDKWVRAPRNLRLRDAHGEYVMGSANSQSRMVTAMDQGPGLEDWNASFPPTSPLPQPPPEHSGDKTVHDWIGLIILAGVGPFDIPVTFFGFIVNLFTATRAETGYWRAVAYVIYMVTNPGERLPYEDTDEANE